MLVCPTYCHSLVTQLVTYVTILAAAINIPQLPVPIDQRSGRLKMLCNPSFFPRPFPHLAGWNALPRDLASTRIADIIQEGRSSRENASWQLRLLQHQCGTSSKSILQPCSTLRNSLRRTPRTRQPVFRQQAATLL